MRRLIRGARSLLAPGLRRTLLARSLLIGLVPMVLISTLALGLAQGLLQERFDGEARLVAGAAKNAIDDRILLTWRGGAVLGSLSGVRDLALARDAKGLRDALVPLKTRLALDIVSVSDANGAIIGAAQDFAPGDRLPPELLVRAQAQAENSWIIVSEPKGLMIRSITPINWTDNSIRPGFIQAGTLLDSKFLHTIRAASDDEIAIIVDGKVKVSTIPGLDAAQLPNTADMPLSLGTSTAELTVDGKRYVAIFGLVQSHATQPLILVTFLPLAPLETAQRQLAAAVLIAGSVLAGLAMLLSYRTARAMTTPLARLANVARRIEKGDLDVPVATGSSHEIGQLEQSFQSMAGALQTRDGENAALVAELRGTNVKLEEASRLKSEFIANVSHELRTPMNAILGYTEFMLEGLDGTLNEQQASDLRRVRTAADNLLGIINGLLDLAKIEAGQMDVDSKLFHVHDVADEVISLLSERARAKNLVLRSDIDPELPSAWADPYQVRQILTNLTANAVKFTERGEITIGAVPADAEIRVVVTDSGEGITPEAQEIIFDEFRQADGSSVRRHGGTGLGLAIARRLVWMNGGRIWVESQPGKGSRFYFTVPTRADAPANTVAATAGAGAERR